MQEMIVSRDTLPEQLLARIQSERVMLRESEDVITLIPLKEKTTGPCRLLGMLAGLGVSTEVYCRQKQLDKELE